MSWIRKEDQRAFQIRKSDVPIKISKISNLKLAIHLSGSSHQVLSLFSDTSSPHHNSSKPPKIPKVT